MRRMCLELRSMDCAEQTEPGGSRVLLPPVGGEMKRRVCELRLHRVDVSVSLPNNYFSIEAHCLSAFSMMARGFLSNICLVFLFENI